MYSENVCYHNQISFIIKLSPLKESVQALVNSVGAGCRSPMKMKSLHRYSRWKIKKKKNCLYLRNFLEDIHTASSTVVYHFFFKTSPVTDVYDDIIT